MNRATVERVLQAGLEQGAEFSELYLQESRSSSLLLKSGEIESATAGTTFGVGLRLIRNGEVLYGFASDNSEESLLSLARRLGQLRPGESRHLPPIQLGEPLFHPDLHPVLFDPRQAGQRRKLPLLQQLDRVTRHCGERIVQVTASALDIVEHVEIYNSESLAVHDDRTRTRMVLNAVASNGSELISAHAAPGALKGFEFFEDLDLDSLAREVGERALRMLDASYITGGQMPVVIGPGFGGVIFHEACGHLLETEAVRRNASAFGDKLGEQIAHPSVTAIDDGTLSGVWGSLAFDDEGMETERTVLIENGVLKNYLSDRVGAAEVGVPRTGSGRRESYSYAPVARMRNTFIAPGESSLDEMVASAGEGLYALKMGGGSVNPATGEFNFAVEEGYRIHNGKIAEAVRGASLIGKGKEILPRISMVGRDLEFAAGMCGASSGTIPVTVGQPTIKLDRILVGGR